MTNAQGKKTESAIENKTHKIPKDFEIQMDHPISARRPDLVLINKERGNLSSSGFCPFHEPSSESENIPKYLDFVSEFNKMRNIKHNANCSWYHWNGPQKPGKETGDHRKNRDHPDVKNI